MPRITRKRVRLPKGRLLGVVRFQEAELHATVIDNEVYLDIHEVGALISFVRGKPLQGAGRNNIGDALRDSGKRLLGYAPLRFCPAWKKSQTSGYTLQDTLELLDRRRHSSDHAAATALRVVVLGSRGKLIMSVADAYAAALDHLVQGDLDAVKLFLAEVILQLTKLTKDKEDAIRRSGIPSSVSP